MDIERKIEEIRKQPEHIRIRYVWGAVAVSMFFILIIWIFSLKLSFQNTANKTEEINLIPQIKNSIQTQKEKLSLPSTNTQEKNNQQ